MASCVNGDSAPSRAPCDGGKVSVSQILPPQRRSIRSTISHLESGEADRLTIGTIRRCVEPLGMRVEVRATWRGAELDRLLDEDHAALETGWDATSGPVGMEMRPEVSYSRYGERGPHRPRWFAPGRPARC